MKGIILAGGKGTRLYPATLAASKQLLPVYNKPMVYYPLTMLMMAGIREILVISTPEDVPHFKRLLGDGSGWGMKFEYAVQDKPRGLADAFIVGKEFVGNEEHVGLVLGDNIFYGHGLQQAISGAASFTLKGAAGNDCGNAVIFAKEVSDPERYGIVEIDREGRPVSIEEKPKKPKSRLAVPGLYFYPRSVLEIAARVKPSARGEIEITDVNREYLRRGELFVQQLGRGTAWLDAGTHEALMQASQFIQAIEERQGFLVGAPEEVAFRMGFIDRNGLLEQAERYQGNYAECLRHVAENP